MLSRKDKWTETYNSDGTRKVASRTPRLFPVISNHFQHASYHHSTLPMVIGHDAVGGLAATQPFSKSSFAAAIKHYACIYEASWVVCGNRSGMAYVPVMVAYAAWQANITIALVVGSAEELRSGWARRAFKWALLRKSAP